MNRLNLSFSAAIFALALAAVPALSQETAGPAASPRGEAQIKAGRMLYVTNSVALAPVYSVASDGSAQILFDGRRITVPASTITELDGKLVTSLSKRDLVELGKGASR